MQAKVEEPGAGHARLAGHPAPEAHLGVPLALERSEPAQRSDPSREVPSCPGGGRILGESEGGPGDVAADRDERALGSRGASLALPRKRAPSARSR